MIVIFMSCWKSCHCSVARLSESRGRGSNRPPPSPRFGKSVNSILIEGPDYAHNTLLLNPSPLRPCALLLDIQSIHHFVSFMTRLLITVTQIFGLARKLEHFLKVPSLFNYLNATWGIHIWLHQFSPLFHPLPHSSLGPVTTFLIPSFIKFSSPLFKRWWRHLWMAPGPYG